MHITWAPKCVLQSHPCPSRAGSLAHSSRDSHHLSVGSGTLDRFQVPRKDRSSKYPVGRSCSFILIV